MRKSAVFLLAALWPAASFAEEPVEIPAITIHGEAEEAQHAVSSSHTRVRASDYQNRVMNLPEVLAEQVGVHITRYGGLEEATSISIRGSQADEVVILLDGIPLNTAEGGGVNLSHIFMDDLDSIDIHRGSAPVQAGFSTSAGLVSLESKKIKKGNRVRASLGYGSFNTLKAQTLASKTWDSFGLLVSNTVSRTSGNFTFLDDNGTPVNRADDQRVERQNNASQTLHPFVKFFYDFDAKTRLEFTGHFIRQDRGVPGMATNQSQTANVDTTESMASARLRKRGLFAENLNVESLTYVRAVKSQYSDLRGEVGLGGAQDNDDDTTLFGHKFSADWFLGKRQVVTPFALYQVERFRPENFAAANSTGSSSLRHSLNVGAGDTIDLWDHRLLVEPAIWLENVWNRINNDDPSFLTPATFSNSSSHHALSARLGVRGQVRPFLALQSHVSRSFRFPTFPELFGDRGGVVGNPFLNPQESVNWDAGFVLETRPEAGAFNVFRLGASYFERRVDDLIQFQQNSGFARAENVGRARIRGIEAEWRTELLAHVAANANYTYQLAKDHANNPGRFLVGRPKNEVNAKLEAWIRQGRAFVSLNWMDESFLDPLNTRVVSDRVFLNSGVSANLLKGFRVSFEAKNLTNEQTVDLVGFPLPGRSFFGRLDWEPKLPPP